MRKWTFIAATLVCVAFLAASGCQKNGANADNRAKERIPLSGADHNPDLTTKHTISDQADEEAAVEDAAEVGAASDFTPAGGDPVTPSSDTVTLPAPDEDAHDSESDSEITPSTPLDAPTIVDSESPADSEPEPPAYTEDSGQASAPPPTSPVSFNRDNIRLLGFAIGDSVDQVIDVHGEAGLMYRIEDADGSLLIYEYDGFTIGFNEQQKIAFIDIASASVESGIIGVQIGSSKNAILDALGTPNMETDFVLNYQSEKLNLKLEIDPENESVHSIKLFPQM